MTLGTNIKNRCGEGKFQNFLSLSLYTPVSRERTPLTGEVNMHRKYVVENWFGNWTVWCEITNEVGEKVARKLTDIFPSYKKDEAMAKAELGNYIVKKSTEVFREMVGVR